MLEPRRILVTGSTGMLGSAIVRNYQKNEPSVEIITDHDEEGIRLVDWTDWDHSRAFMQNVGVTNITYFCAAHVGGIQANIDNGLKYYTINSDIATNTIRAWNHYNDNRFVNISSSCIHSPWSQIVKPPFKPGDWKFNEPEDTNYGYAMAKREAINMMKVFKKYEEKKMVTMILPNLFGPGDTYEDNKSHFVAALIKRIYTAKKFKERFVGIWGDGSQVREIMHVDDAAQQIIRATSIPEVWKPDRDSINISHGKKYTVKDVAETIRGVLKYEGFLYCDKEKPVGMQEKYMEAGKFMGTPKFENLAEEIYDTVKDLINE